MATIVRVNKCDFIIKLSCLKSWALVLQDDRQDEAVVEKEFLHDLKLVFDNLVDITEPICQAIDTEKADMTIFDSSGIEAFVTENNPKYANRIGIVTASTGAAVRDIINIAKRVFNYKTRSLKTA